MTRPARHLWPLLLLSLAGCAPAPSSLESRVADLEECVVAMQDYLERMGEPKETFTWGDITYTATDFIRPGDTEFRDSHPGLPTDTRWKLFATGPGQLRDQVSRNPMWRTYAWREHPQEVTE